MTAVATTTIVSCLLALLNINDATVVNRVILITVASVMDSYLIVACLTLYRRLTIGILPRNDDDTLTNTTGAGLTWGLRRLEGFMGIGLQCLCLCLSCFHVFLQLLAGNR